MDNATKHKLKQQDQFVALTGSGVHWASRNRRTAIVSAGIILVVILAIVGGYTFYEHRTTQAESAFGAAMQVYATPVQNPAQPVPPGIKTFPDATSRAAAANTQFATVASRFNLLHTGKLAEYFVGLTYADQGKTGPAEDALKQTASSWNADLAALGKMALAQLYQQTGRDAQAIDLYNELAKGKAVSVPPGLAQIQLAELYQSEGKTDQARKIYAELKDKDKNSKGKPGAAGQIATQKLNPTAAAQGPAAQ